MWKLDLPTEIASQVRRMMSHRICSRPSARRSFRLLCFFSSTRLLHVSKTLKRMHEYRLPLAQVFYLLLQCGPPKGRARLPSSRQQRGSKGEATEAAVRKHVDATVGHLGLAADISCSLESL